MTSVVIPAFDAADVLRVTVPAVLALSGVAEVVWVNDGSADETGDVLRALTAGDGRARIVSLPRNAGRSAARNAGVAATAGGMIVFFDADVEPPAGAARALAEAARRPGAVAGVALLDPVVTDPADPYQDYLAHHRRGPDPGALPDAALDWRFFLSGACGVRRDALDAAGGFDEAIGYGEDVGLARALTRRSPDGLRLARATVRLHDLGRLPDALARAAAFGRSTSALATSGAERPPWWTAFARPARWSVGPLRAAVVRMPPGPARRRLVRYLLAATIVSASRA